MNIEDAPKLSIRNRAAVEATEVVSCYFCLRVSPAASVTDWTDDGQTAHCPHCDIDAVLPGRLDQGTLADLHVRWFTEST